MIEKLNSLGVVTTVRSTSRTDVGSKYVSPWRYNSPLVQVLISSIVAFGCPGMYNALSGIGGAGQLDTSVAATGNIAQSAISASTVLFIGPIVYHYLGPRWTMFIGGIAYPLYGGSLLAYNHIENSAFVIATSAILGLGATFFWIAQGAIMTGSPLAGDKGKMVGMFWCIFNMGGVIGSFISMGVNWKKEEGTVSDGTYAAFIALMCMGFLSSLFMCNPSRVIRTDGSRVQSKAVRPDVIKDFIEIIKIFGRKEAIVMTPFFLMANWFYSYQQNTVNANLFDIRTRSFNGAMYWAAQMLGSPLIGALLDWKRLSRRRRGFIAYLIICVFSLALWGGGLGLQLKAAPDKNADGNYYYSSNNLMDMIHSHSKYAGPFVLYFFYGVFDSVWQTMAYWLIGALGQDDTPNEDLFLARFVGLYKSMQGVGGAIAWKINARGTNYNVEFAINWGLVSGSLLILAPIFWWIQDERAPDVISGIPAEEGTYTDKYQKV